MNHSSAALQRITPSPTIEMTRRAAAMKAQGIDVIGLSAGEPDFETPDHVKDAGIEAIRAGKTGYTDVDGTPELKAAIVAKFRRENNLSYTTAQISVNSGGKHTLFNALVATIDPGDEVIVPAPYWVSYPDIVRFAGGTPVIVEANAAQGYKITPTQLDAAITPRTRWLILNSPSNPTGAAYARAELAALGEVLERHPQVLVLTDDIYEHVWYADHPFCTFAEACPALFDRTLTMNGVSKAYAMTGWRIGYAGGPEWLIKAMGKLQSQSTSNPCSISQAASVAALNGPQDFLHVRAQSFEERRDLVVAMLNDAPGLNCPVPDGAFYVFPDASGLMGTTSPTGAKITDDSALADYFLTEAHVAVVPGSAFGSRGAFRISYAAAIDHLREACTRIQRACAALG